MAGRKHYLQQHGYMNNDWNKIQDPFERDFAFRSLQATPYCQFCGEEIIDSEMDKEGSKVDWEWEQKNLMHYKCLGKKKAEKEEQARLAAAKAELERAEKEANFDWDNYMKDMLGKRE
jgi:hypothetical protein